MSFSTYCVAIVLFAAIAVVTLGFGYLTGTDDDVPFGAWLMSTFGFGICLMYILITKDVI